MTPDPATLPTVPAVAIVNSNIMPVPKAKEEGKQTSLKSRLQEYANKRKVIDEEAKQIVQPQQQVEEVK